MPLGREVGLGPGDIVLDGDPAPPKVHSLQFSAHVYCGQTVAHLNYCWTLVTYTPPGFGASVGVTPLEFRRDLQEK